MEHSLFENCLHYILPFRLGGPVKVAEEEEDLLSDLITTVFVDQLLALPGTVQYRGRGYKKI